MSGSGLLRELTRNRKVDAAIQNEYATRQRVERLEKLLAVVFPELERHRALLGLNFWGRLRWILTGR